ncbi:MAG: hypothetical protein DRO88_05870 [Promethearchaeia archaeon]|nr:MAG: hypothetical protein DRO88_05870 [Candidatus Lokiarchaeia archaeon]
MAQIIHKIKKHFSRSNSRLSVLLGCFILLAGVLPVVDDNLIPVNRENPLNSLKVQIEWPKGAENLEQIVSYLIIAPDDYVESLQSLASWKSQKGEPALIMPVSEIISQYSGVDLAAKIKNCIENYYLHNQTKWVLLAGDVDEIPSREAYAPEDYPYDGDFVSCDSYYSDLDHDWDSNHNGIWGELDDGIDYHPEVYVGRLSGNSDEEIRQLAHRIVQYESTPPEGNWFGSTLMAGAQLFFDEDWDNDSEPDYLGADYNRFTHYVDDTLLHGVVNGSRWFLGETEGLAPTNYPVNESLNEQNLIDALNSGFALGAIAGHGNPTAMYRTLFTQDYDGDGLFDRNGTDYYAPAVDETISIPFISTYSDYSSSISNLGFYYLGGCSVGTFNESQDCLTETILKTVGIGSIGGSQVVWGEDEWFERDFGGWYSDGLTYRFFEQLVTYGQPGAALAHAKEDYVIDRANPLYYNADRPYFPDWENKTLKQFNLMGDPEVRLWLDAPKHMNVSLDNSPEFTDIQVNESNGLPLANAIVTVTNQSSVLFKGLTAQNGSLRLEFNSTKLANLNLTIYQPGFLPFQQLVQIPVEETPSDDTSTDDTTSDDASTDDTTSDDSNGGIKIPGYSSGIFLGVFAFSLIILYRKIR